MPMPVPWQTLLPFSYQDDSGDQPRKPVVAAPDADNSAIMGIRDPKARAEAIARALAAGVKGADPKQLARSVEEGERHDDV